MVTIPDPHLVPRVYGADKTNSIHFRCDDEEYNIISKLAEKIGMTRSELVRYCAVKVALAMEKKDDDITRESS